MTKHAFVAAIIVCGIAVSPPILQVRADESAPETPAFSCGPHLETYSVRSLDGAPGEGIRCVKWSDGTFKKRVPVFAWYGEGNWRGYPYRHLGQAYARNAKASNVLKGYAADFMGNGEATEGFYNGNLVVTVVDKNTIQVTGIWDEEWTRVTAMEYQPLPAPATCGKYFDEYRAYSIAAYSRRGTAAQNAKGGQGLRCALRAGPRSTIWYGVGAWNGKAYAHLTTGSTKGWGSSDFCSAAEDYCGDFAFGTIRLRRDARLRALVVDGWNEVWIKK